LLATFISTVILLSEFGRIHDHSLFSRDSGGRSVGQSRKLLLINTDIAMVATMCGIILASNNHITE
jgi:hypothetical protein